MAAPTRAQTEPAPEAGRAEALRKFGLDTASPLESRVREAPASVMKLFENAGGPLPTAHALTDAERKQVAAAFAALPPLHRRVLSERLRGISFLDGMPNTGLASQVNPDEPYRLYDIIIRAGVLRQTASEWLTEKERTVFDEAGSPLSVSIEAGKGGALLFVLLHEATHVVDYCLGVTPRLEAPVRPGPPPPAPIRHTPFTEGVWSDLQTPAPAYRDPLRAQARFFAPNRKVSVERAPAVYASLRQTPFVSLYGGMNWSDDLAEYLSVYHWTEVLKQPFRVTVERFGVPVFTHEPMKGELVRGRAAQMKRFYEAQP